jgi:hypothetical protein
MICHVQKWIHDKVSLYILVLSNLHAVISATEKGITDESKNDSARMQHSDPSEARAPCVLISP